MAELVNIVIEEVVTEINITVSEVATLGYTAEDVANKAINFVTSNDVLYPTVKAVVDFTAGTYSAIGHSHTIYNVTGLQDALDGKQATLVSNTNIKTINGVSILGSGDLSVSASSTLLQISATSTTAPNSVYQMSAGIPVHFKTSDANTLLYLDETNERVGIGTATPTYPLTFNQSSTAITSTSTAIGRSAFFGYNNGYGGLQIGVNSTGAGFIQNVDNTTTAYAFTIQPYGGELIIGTPAGLAYGGNKLAVNGNIYTNGLFKAYSAPTASANYGLVSLGNGAFDGSTSGFFTGSASGTGLAMNLASGSASDLLNLQVAGVPKLTVSNGAFAPGAVATAYSGLSLSNTYGSTGAASGAYKPVNITYIINNTGAANTGTATGIFLNATETALNGMTHNLIDLQVGNVTKIKGDNSGNFTVAKYYISALNTAPANAGDTGTLGEIRFTNGYLYLCSATNTWLRAALTTW